MMIAKIYVTLKRGVLDPQGKTVHRSLSTLGFDTIDDIRIGKFIEVKLKAGVSKEDATAQVNKMCQKLLVNEVIEEFSFDLLEAGS